MTAEQLWHFTCEHAHQEIGKRGILLPNQHQLMPRLGPVVWLTSDPAPDRDDVGLTSSYLKCDRMAYRYRGASHPGVYPWSDVRGQVAPPLRDDLERYGQPDTWWLSSGPVAAVLA